MTTQHRADVQKVMVAALVVALGVLCIAPALIQGSVWWQVLGLALLGVGGWVLIPPALRLISQRGADAKPSRRHEK